MLTGCGGGGSHGGLTLSLSPSSVTRTFFEGDAEVFVVTGTVGGTVSGAVNMVIQDPVGVIQPDVGIQQVSDVTYEATFTTSTTLAAGNYTGDIGIALCGSLPPACSPRYASRNLRYSFTVQDRPTPVVSSILPSQSTAGGGDFDLTVDGSNFFPSSVVVFDGTPLATTYLSANQLRALVTANVIADGGTRPVIVVTTPATSAPVFHQVNNPVPALAAVSPGTTAVGCGAFTLTAAGGGFVQSSVVQWQGSPLATTFVSPTLLRAAVPAGLITSAGDIQVKIGTPGPGGGVSQSHDVAVGESPPAASKAVAYQVNPAHTGIANSSCPESLSDAPLWDVDVGGKPSYPIIADGRVIVTVQRLGNPDFTVGLLALERETGSVAWGPLLVAGLDNRAGRALPTYDNGKVFVASDVDPAMPYDFVGGFQPGSVQARNAATGALLWRRSLNEAGLIAGLSAPTAANGRIYTGSSVNFIGAQTRAYDQGDGSTVWTAGAPLGTSPPAVTATAVYRVEACVTDALDPLTGGVVWSRSSGGCVSGSGASAVPVVSDGRVYASMPKFLLGSGFPIYDAVTGSETGTYLQSALSPVDGGTGYLVTSQSFFLAATTMASGAVLWQWAPAPGGPPFPNVTPVVVDDRVIAGTPGGQLWAVDAATGAVLWTTDQGGNLPQGKNDFSYPPASPPSGLAVGENLLVVPVGNRLRAYRTGN